MATSPTADDTLPRDVLRAFAQFDLDAGALTVADVGAVSRAGPHHDVNQDAWGRRHGSTFVVADGMGGRPGGDLAAATAVAVVLDELGATARRHDATDWERVIANTNTAVLDAGRRGGHQRVGTTLAVLRCAGQRVTIAHVGDTRVYRLRGGRAECVTVDHNVREELIAAGLDPLRFGATARQLAGLTGYLGDDATWRRFAVRNLLARPGDRFALVSDGVHGWADEAAWRVAADAATGATAATTLVESAVGAGSHDDLTALVVDVAAGGTARGAA